MPHLCEMAHGASALDFAASEPDPAGRAEIRSTVQDLLGSFGKQAVLECLEDSGLHATAAGQNREGELLRNYSCLILDDRRPRLIARLVGHLVGLDLASGQPPTLEEIGRPFGLSKQAVSKRLAVLAEKLGLARPMAEKARNSHRLMNRRNFGPRRPAVT